jgi:hypothetical protein
MLTFEHKDAVQVVKNNLGFVFPPVVDLAGRGLVLILGLIQRESYH